jgi:hypothetical protein
MSNTSQVTSAQFAEDFPEFSNLQVYPASAIDFWLNFAAIMVDPLGQMGAALPMGQELFAAHNLVLERQAIAAALNGGAPGLSTGMISGKSVDKVSINYSTSDAMMEDAGHWNLTTFGMRFRMLINMFGHVPLQIGTPGYGPPGSSADAWLGPWVFNFPNPVL